MTSYEQDSRLVVFFTSEKQTTDDNTKCKMLDQSVPVDFVIFGRDL